MRLTKEMARKAIQAVKDRKMWDTFIPEVRDFLRACEENLPAAKTERAKRRKAAQKAKGGVDGMAS